MLFSCILISLISVAMSASKFLFSETEQKNRALLDNQKQQTHTHTKTFWS